MNTSTGYSHGGHDDLGTSQADQLQEYLLVTLKDLLEQLGSCPCL